MSLDLQPSEDRVLTSVDELVGFFRSAEKPAAQHLLGLEHEKFLYPRGSAQAVPYQGAQGIGALLEKLQENGYQAFKEAPDKPTIALTRPQLTLSLEPGGQFELSGSPLRTAQEVHRENTAHLKELRAAADTLGLFPVALGYRPFDRLSDVQWMPKTRYQMMRAALPPRGGLALNMMLMTATGQISLDWETEEDCARKMTATARLSPLLVALFANSPLSEGKPTGMMSYRSFIWTDVDPTRCGYFPGMVDGTFRYQSYVDWAMKAPLLFLRRRGEYLRPKITFGQLLQEGFEGKPAVYQDWIDHLSTLFPEVRIKKVLEIRSADCVSLELTGAFAALWRGILYDSQSLDQALKLIPFRSFERHLQFHQLGREKGLRGVWEGQTLAGWGKQLIEIARGGLRRLDLSAQPAGDDASLLEPLDQVVSDGRSPAEDVLREWNKLKDPVALLARFSL